MPDVTSDLYSLFGVLPDADPATIRHAYRLLARTNHPDLIGGSSGEMARLNAAWSVLRDPRQRRAYDRTRPPSDRDEPIQRPVTADPGPLERRSGGRPAESGTVLDFGRYAGWSLTRLAQHDTNYLEWLARVPIGRRLRPEIDRLLAAVAVPTMTRPSATRRRRGRFWHH